MRFYVGITDDAWFNFLSQRNPDEVNFWRPGGGRSFHAVETGAPFLFKLHSPNNVIAGGGFFVSHSIVPLSMAWAAFGQKNGMDTLSQFHAKVSHLGHRQEVDPNIGCTILADPFFLPENEWIPVPEDWSKNIVSGKGYDTEEQVGMGLWNKVQERLLLHAVQTPVANVSGDPAENPRYGKEYLARARLGQGAFRILVTDAYHRRCAITGERTLPVLEACHIKPFSENGPNSINNGLLLRSDLHILFDQGYLTVTPDMHVEVSGRIKERFQNGREYYSFHGKTLTGLPDSSSDLPMTSFLSWHNQYRFAS